MLDIVNYFTQLPIWELLAVLLSVAYVILVAQNNPLCWPAAFLSTLIFTLLFFDVSLLMESLLNGYYMAMAIYGWLQWQKQDKSVQNGITNNNVQSNTGNQLPIISWHINYHIKIIAILSIISTFVGFIMDSYTYADYAYLDSFTTVFAVFTTYLVTIKVRENWLYWFVINGLSVYLYIQKGLEPTAALAVLNIVMCVIGWFKWQKIYLKQNLTELSLTIGTNGET